MLKHIRRFTREKRVHTPLSQFHSRSFTKPGPYGVVLIMSPWNYPFLLSLDPLIDAIAAGNTVILKPSAYSPNTSKLIEKMIRECFLRRWLQLSPVDVRKTPACWKNILIHLFHRQSECRQRSDEKILRTSYSCNA